MFLNIVQNNKSDFEIKSIHHPALLASDFAHISRQMKIRIRVCQKVDFNTFNFRLNILVGLWIERCQHSTLMVKHDTSLHSGKIQWGFLVLNAAVVEVKNWCSDTEGSSADNSDWISFCSSSSSVDETIVLVSLMHFSQIAMHTCFFFKIPSSGLFHQLMSLSSLSVLCLRRK